MDLFEQLSGMDFISVTDLEDKDSEPFDMCVLNVVKYKDGLYILAAAADDDLSDEENEDEEEGPAEDAFVFKVCDEDSAEFAIKEYDEKTAIFVTTDMPSDEFANVAELLAESDDYDLEIESD